MFSSKNLLNLLIGISTTIFSSYCLSQAPNQDWDKAMKFWEDNKSLCHDTTTNMDYPSKANCDDGDMTLFNGLLCASGVSLGCKGVEKAQRSDGSWHRSPRLASDPTLRPTNSFSPDMAHGVLLWAITTKDSEETRSKMARWIRWLEENQECKISEENKRECDIKVCIDHTEGGCYLSKGDLSVFAATIIALGLEKEIHDNDLLNLINREAKNADIWAWVGASTAKLGFPLHLAAVKILLLKMLNVQELNARLRSAAQILYGRQQENPFFLFLSNEQTSPVKQMVLQKCPTEESQLGLKNEWAWERCDADKAWLKSMLWDCIFMGQLLEKNRNIN